MTTNDPDPESDDQVSDDQVSDDQISDDQISDDLPTKDQQDELRGDQGQAKQIESTVDSIEDAFADHASSLQGEPEATGFDPNATLGIDPNPGSGMIKPFGIDLSESLDESKQFDTTTVIEVSHGDLVADPSLDDTNELGSATEEFSVDDVDVDLANAENDATYLLDDVRDASSLDATVQLNDGDTHGSSAGFDGLIGQTDDVEPNAIDKTDIRQTVNPRELSPKDQEFWGSLLVSRGESVSGQDVTNLRPAIDRSISETNLRIRSRNVSTPKQPSRADSDYRLIRLLGKGGMGNVFVAKQSSLDRLIAVKVIKPMPEAKRKKLQSKGRLKDVEEDRRQQFLSEAVVTGDLDHPNIVPIHDIAVTGDDTLFYAMKRVVGTPWNKVIKDKTRDENIDILMKVCDAIGFAHTRGVVHRDIKPENIMLGDFGVVLVMDWGLALAKPEFEKIDSIVHTAGLGGTPAFMAPEMATGPIEKIGPASDVYLLGATLFLIITDTAPHQAETISLCVKAVARNKIRDFDDSFRGELMNIALKAMATDPQDRYSDVKSFQAAIRQYRSHSESIALAKLAKQDYERGVEDQAYTDFSRATYGYEQAINLWTENIAAREGLQQTTLAHAEAAYANEDFDLGLSILDEGDPSHQPLIEKLEQGLKERESRQSRLTLFRRAAVAMVAFIVIGGSIMLYLINDQRQKALSAAKEAKEQTGIAEQQREIAQDKTKIALEKTKEVIAKNAIVEQQRIAAVALRKEADEQAKEARDQTKIAKQRKAEAEKSEEKALENKRLAEANATKAIAKEKEALEQKEKAQYEVYLSQIGLAKARIERNEFDDARRILEELREIRSDDKLGWEWRWLWRQANQSQAAKPTTTSMIDLDVSNNGKLAVAVQENGTVELLELADDGTVTKQKNVRVATQHPVVAAAISKDTEMIALGTSAGDLQLWDAQLQSRQRELKGHEQKITDLHFAADGRLVSGSTDRTARVWDPQSGKQIFECWHIAAVIDVATAQRDGSTVLATAVADRRSGRAVVWKISAGTKPIRIGEFLQHDRPVQSIALSTDGALAATGDVAGNVYLWRPSSVRKAEFESAIASAIEQVGGEKDRNVARKAQRRLPQNTTIGRLVDPSLSVTPTRLISTRATTNPFRAHQDIVETIQFSDDNSQLLTGADDYTLKIWNVSSRKLSKTLRGHGGWVTGAEFVAGDTGKVLSISKDASIRTWSPTTYIQDVVLTRGPESPNETGPNETGPNTTGQNTTGQNARSNASDIRQSSPHQDEVWSARFDPSGNRIVSASRDHTARVLRIDRESMSFTEVARMQTSEAETKRSRLDEGTAFMAMSAIVDRKHGHLFVGSADSTVRIWDLVLGTQIGQVSGTGLNNSLAISGNGRLLLTGSSSPKAKAILWGIDPVDPKSPKLLYRIKGHEQAVTAFAIAPNGRTFFTGDRSGIGWFWNTETGSRIGTAVEFARGYRINAAEFSPDGTELLVASDDQQLTRVSVDSQQRLGRLSHDGFVTALSLSGDGKRALTISELTTRNQFVAKARIWNLETGQSRVLDRVDSAIQKDEITDRQPPRVRITSASFGGQDRLVVIGRSAGKNRPARVKVWDLANAAAKPKTLDLPRLLGPIQSAMPLTSQHMLTLNGDAAFLWNLDSMMHEKSYRAHAALTQASFSFDGKYIATGSRSVKIWDSHSGVAVGKIESPHRGPVRSVQFSKRGPDYMLATTGDDGYAIVWRWTPGTSQFDQLAAYQLTVGTGSEQRLPGRCVSFSPDGQSLLAAGVGGIARIWKLGSNQAVVYDLPNGGTFNCCEFSADGNWIAIGSSDKNARLWKVVEPGQTSEQPIILEGHADQIEDIRILQDQSDELRILTASLDKSARVWDPRIGSPDKRGRELVTLRKHTLGVTAVDATSNGELVMTAGRDGTVILWPATKSNNSTLRPKEIGNAPADNLFESLLHD